MMPTACSDQSPATSQRCCSGRSARRQAGWTGSWVIGGGGCRLGLGWRRDGAGLEEQRLVDLPGLALGGGLEQLAGHDHQGARIALSVIAERGDHSGGHQVGRAGLLQGVPEALLEVLRRGAFDRQAHAHAAGEREELIGAQAFGEASVAGEHDGQQDVGIEIGGGEQAQFGEHGGLHLLRLIDDEHRSGQRALDVRLPALAQDLGAGEAVMRAQFDTEEFAHLAIEVGDVGLRPADHADGDVALVGQRCRQDAQGGGFAAAGRAGDEGEAAVAGELLHAPAERIPGAG